MKEFVNEMECGFFKKLMQVPKIEESATSFWLELVKSLPLFNSERQFSLKLIESI